jgi:hypothetical protein
MSNFDKLTQKLAGQKGVSDPAGLAAYIGRKKFGAKTFDKAAAKGVSASSVAKKK